jgi:outer membrane protein OmpA-like peptidoglycan-associated protein
MCSMFVFCDAQALERRYLAEMENSQWLMSEYSVTQCRIEHSIPRFGVAAFIQEPGRGLRLELTTKHRFSKGINVELRSETNYWNSHEVRVVLARFETTGGKKLFDIPTSVAEQTFDELSQGFQPGFLFYDDYPLIASISAVQFGKVTAEFSQCVSRLHKDNFGDVRVSSILFGPDEEFASLEQEDTAFKKMFDYLAIDNSISDILITGHTDKSGNACYNKGLSERRAHYVYDLLIAPGVDATRLRVDYLGEEKQTRHRNSNSRAANRRVTVELRR